jgi:hypothetical protein
MAKALNWTGPLGAGRRTVEAVCCVPSGLADHSKSADSNCLGPGRTAGRGSRRHRGRGGAGRHAQVGDSEALRERRVGAACSGRGGALSTGAWRLGLGGTEESLDLLLAECQIEEAGTGSLGPGTIAHIL